MILKVDIALQKSQQQIKKFLGQLGSSDTQALCKRLGRLSAAKFPMITESVQLQVATSAGIALHPGSQPNASYQIN